MRRWYSEGSEGGREVGREDTGLAFFYKKLPSGIKKLKTSMLFQFLFCLMLQRAAQNKGAWHTQKMVFLACSIDRRCVWLVFGNDFSTATGRMETDGSTTTLDEIRIKRTKRLCFIKLTTLVARTVLWGSHRLQYHVCCGNVTTP